MLFAIRDDDTAFFTKPEELESAYDFVKEGQISLSVVPNTVSVHRDDVFPYGCEDDVVKSAKYNLLGENVELVSYLKQGIANGRYEILLHGYTHEYQKIKERWTAEMIWKSLEQLTEEIPYGKQYLEKVLATEIKIFVAPNNSINQKAISVISNLGMDYSGIIQFNDRKVNIKYLKNFLTRWVVRLIKRIPYPGVLNYGDHRELVAYTLDEVERLKKEYNICKNKGVPFVIYTHYWQVNSDPKVKEMLVEIYNYAVADGAKLVKLSDCFGNINSD